MLHELLITLSGFPGDIFRPFPPEPSKPTTFAVHDFPLLHPAEKEGLDRLAQLGFYFKEFNDFIAAYRTPTFASSSVPQQRQGLYLKALANTLEARLQGYRKTIIQTEALILSGQDNLGGMVPLSTISARFAPYELVFPAISNLISQIHIGYTSPEHERHIAYSGGVLIDLLQDKAASGVPIQKEWMNDLLQGCCAVMMRQIVSWVIYGQIQDPFGEFFIYSLESTSSGASVNSSFFRSHLQDSTTTHSRDMSVSASHRSSTSSKGSVKWQAEYALHDKLIPAMIPPPLAQAMLFIGKSIATSKQAKPKPIPIPQAMTQRHLGLILPLIMTSTTATSADPDPARDSTIPRSLNLNQLTHVIHQIRTDIANHLWVVVQVGERVVWALESFRRYFLLGDGEFTLKLIDGLEEFKRNRLSRLGPNINSAGAVSIRDHDLGGLMSKAAQGAQSAREDPCLKNFDLRLQRPSGTKDISGGMFDDQLLGIPVRLWYTLAWPLDFFLTVDDLAQYGDIFAFLMTVRKAQVKLQQTWIHVKAMAQGVIARKRREKKQQGPMLFKRQTPGQLSAADTGENTDGVDLNLQESEMIKHVGAIRSDMAFVVDCLWTYLQTDVIGPTFDSLLHSIVTHESASNLKASEPGAPSASSQTFDSIHSSHAEALYEIRRACLLTSQSLSQCLKDILQEVEAFCGIVSRRAATAGGGGGQEGSFRAGLGDDQDDKMWQDWTDIMQLNKAFREDTDRLFSDLSTVSRSGTLGDAPYLKRSTSGLGSSVLGNGPQAFDMARQVDQLLLRLEFFKSMRFNSVAQEEE